MAVGKVESKSDIVNFIRFRPHTGVLEHVRVFPGPFIIQVAHHSLGSVLQYRNTVDRTPVACCQYKFVFNIFAHIVFITGTGPYPNQFSCDIAGIRISDKAHADLGIAHNSFFVGLKHT